MVPLHQRARQAAVRHRARGRGPPAARHQRRHRHRSRRPLTPALLEGRLDGSPALWRDPAREAKLFYSKPYLENRLVLVGRKGHDVSAPALPALAGKKIAVVGGYAHGDALLSGRGPTYVTAGTVEESLEKVLTGEADYVLMDELVVEYLLANHPEEVKARLAIGTQPLLVRRSTSRSAATCPARIHRRRASTPRSRR